VVLKTNLARLGPVVDRELSEAENRRLQERERSELQTRLVRLNEELRASELQYRLLFEHNPQPMLVYDQHTLEIATGNDALVERYGYSHRELLSMTIKDLLVPEEVDDLIRFPSLQSRRRPAGTSRNARSRLAAPLQGRHDH